MFDLVNGQVLETRVRAHLVQIYIKIVICSVHSVPQTAKVLIYSEQISRS